MQDQTTQKTALNLMARGYSPIACAHILGIRLSIIDQWLKNTDFVARLNQARSTQPPVMEGL